MSSLTGVTISSSTSQYEVQRVLGSGNFGIVAQCRKKSTNELVALKVIKDKNSCEEAKEEAELLNKIKALGSEKFNIVKFNGSFIYCGHFCLDFELLDISLYQYIQQRKFLQLEEIRPIIRQLAVALCFLDSVEVVQTDLKPENIMLVDRTQRPPKVKIIDFGWALSNPERHTGVTLQSRWYRSPEVLLGSPINRSIDIWSLGCISAEMLNGAPLFPGKNEYQMIQQIVSTVGQPPHCVMKNGCYTKRFFRERHKKTWHHCWILKIQSKYSPEYPNNDLNDLCMVSGEIPAEDAGACECDRVCFVDLLRKMLNPDPARRISPGEILSHPYMTLSHLSRQSNNSHYLASSIKHMAACFDGGAKADLNHSESISRSIEQTVVDMQCAPTNRSPPPVKKITNHTNNRRIPRATKTLSTTKDCERKRGRKARILRNHSLSSTEEDVYMQCP